METQSALMYDCPFCAWKTDDAKKLVQHLAMAERSHAVLTEEASLNYVVREIQSRWEN